MSKFWIIKRRIICKLHIQREKFTRNAVQKLFLSVGWISGQYPDRLYKALLHSSTVLTAGDGENLVGMIRVLDDGEILAYVHYVLVDPAYQGHGIAGTMVELIKEKYKDYLYSELMPEASKNAAFYQKLGFQVMPNGVAMQRCNFGNPR